MEEKEVSKSDLEVRRREILDRVKQIDGEKTGDVEKRERLKESVARMSENLVSEEQKLMELQREERKKYLNLSVGGYEDKLLQLRSKPATMTVLEANIGKLSSDIKLFNEEIATLDLEKQKCEKELDDNKVKQLSISSAEGFDRIVEFVEDLQVTYKMLISQIAEVRAIDQRNWPNKFEEAGLKDRKLDLLASSLTDMPGSVLE